MNNDKDTEAPVALELAKRGFVVVSVDQHNHGDSDIGADTLGSYLGTGEVYENDTMGAQVMYQFLKTSEFVDGSQLGLIGHSMGGGTVRDLALRNPDHRAIIIQASGLDNATEIANYNNYLNVWMYYEELFVSEDTSRASFIAEGKALITANLADIGETPIGDTVDENYGSFALGTAQRYALCPSIHPAATWNRKSIRESVAWMLQALMGETSPAAAMEQATAQTYIYKELSTLFALISVILSILPFVSMMLGTNYFKELVTPLSEKIPNPKGKWWKVATINTLIGGATFIFLPGLGMFVGGFLAILLPVWLMLTGNGTLVWMLINAGICFGLFKLWYKRNHEKLDITYEDLGAFSRKNKTQDDQRYLRKTMLLTVLIFMYMYVLATAIQSYLKVELRFMWPVLKIFTPLRFAQFLVYLLPVYLFFKMNGGLFMFGQARVDFGKSKLGTIGAWLKYIFAMEAGLLLVFLIQYLPMWIFDLGPGFSFGFIGMVFGLFGIFLMQSLPQFALIFLIMIVLYRKTGKIYLGAYIATMLTAWILVVSGQLI